MKDLDKELDPQYVQKLQRNSLPTDERVARFPSDFSSIQITVQETDNLFNC